MNKGFTLVELLAVIVVLGLVIVIVGTNGFGAFNKTKKAINQIEEDNLLEAAKVFLVDVDNGLCEADTTFCRVETGTPVDCCEVRTYEGSAIIKVEYLINHNYFKDDDKHCNRDQEIKVQIEKVDGNTTGYKSWKNDPDEVICSKK